MAAANPAHLPHDDRFRDEVGLSKLGGGFGLVGILGLVAMGVLAATSVEAAQAYLYGWMFAFTLTLGCFGLNLLHHTVRAKWTMSIIRLLEAGSSPAMFLTLAVTFLPLAFQFSHIYEWANADMLAKDHVLRFKAAGYLNVPFFIVRFVIYFGSWALISYAFRRSVARQEATKDFNYERKRMTWGALSLVWFMLSATFALTDFGMSLEPHWSSTMYGPWMIIAGGGAALALCIVALMVNAHKSPFDSYVHPGLIKDLGNMLFAFTMLWGYTTVSQYLIIWNGNIPEFTSYFAKRSNHLADASHGAAHGVAEAVSKAETLAPAAMHTVWWGALGLALILGRFFIPFFTLLAPRVKKVPLRLARIAGWIVVLHVIDVYMLVIPAFHGRNPNGPFALNLETLYDLVAVLAHFALWLGVWGFMSGRLPIIATYDDRLQEAKLHAH